MKPTSDTNHQATLRVLVFTRPVNADQLKFDRVLRLSQLAMGLAGGSTCGQSTDFELEVEPIFPRKALRNLEPVTTARAR